MKIRTWHLEGLAVATALAGALLAFGKAGDWREWVAALGVQLGFHHASVASRLQEAEEQRRCAELRGSLQHGGAWQEQASAMVPYVACVDMLQRYWLLKEAAWVTYFLATGAVSALVGCAAFVVHPFWRRWYRSRYHHN